MTDPREYRVRPHPAPARPPGGGSKRDDRELGMDRAITRRDFVYGSALLLGTAAAGCGPGERRSDQADRPSPSAGTGGFDFEVGDAWYGPGGVGDYAASHGNTPALVRAAHEIRAGRFREAPQGAIDSGEEYDLVVVGGGFSGLSAAHHFRRLVPDGRVLILDNHPIFGGEAKRNDFDVNGTVVSGPQGSNDFGVPAATGEPDDYFTSLGIPRDLRYAEPTGSAAGLRIPTDNYAFLHWQQEQFSVGHYFGSGGRWVRDLWRDGLEESPWSADVRVAFLAARAEDAQGHAIGRGEIGPWLDSMTMRDYYLDVLGLPTEVPDYMDPIVASVIGLGCDAISAWWGLHFELPGFQTPDRYENLTFHSFPGGNAGLARYFLRDLVPDGLGGGADLEDVLFAPVALDRLDRPDAPVRFRLGATVVRVEHEGALERSERVVVTYTVDGEIHRLRARNVVMASGGWVNRHVLVDLPDAHRQAYDAFSHSPVLVANVALTNWRFLERLGSAAFLWTDGFGFAANIRRPMIVGGRSQPLDPDQPIVMTFYVPLFRPGLPLRQQGIEGRTELLSTPFAGYERRIREQMVTLFGDSGFDPARDIAGIILNRWGHAYVNPGPGFQFGRDGASAPPDVIREPLGRIAIGHSELRGHQNWTGATAEGRRAVEGLVG